MPNFLLKRKFSKSYLFGFSAIWLTQVAVLLSVNGLIWDGTTYLVRVLPLVFLLVLPSRDNVLINPFVVLLTSLLLLRILFHLFIEPTSGTSGFVYLFRFLSSIVLPLFIFTVRTVDYEKFYKGFVHCVLLFVFIGIILYRGIIFIPYRNIHHFTSFTEEELISPLSFAYSGLFLLISTLSYYRNLITRVIIGLLSLYLIVWSGTRSVSIAAFILILLHFPWKLNLMVGLFIIMLFPLLDTVFFSGLADRFILLYTEIIEGGNVGSYRKGGYEEVLVGLDYFTIWLGYGIELESTDYVAHSIVFETLHMSGITGLILLVGALLTASFKNRWLPFKYLFLSRLITGIVSNSILDPISWYFLFFLRKKSK